MKQFGRYCCCPRSVDKQEACKVYHREVESCVSQRSGYGVELESCVSQRSGYWESQSHVEIQSRSRSQKRGPNDRSFGSSTQNIGRLQDQGGRWVRCTHKWEKLVMFVVVQYFHRLEEAQAECIVVQYSDQCRYLGIIHRLEGHHCSLEHKDPRIS